MKTIPDPETSFRPDPKLVAAETRRGTKLQVKETKETGRLIAALGVSLADLEARADLDFASAKLEAEAALARARSLQAQRLRGLAALRERLEAQYVRLEGKV